MIQAHRRAEEVDPPVAALRAPKADGALAAHPPLAAAQALLASNRRCLANAAIDIGGRSLADLRHEARQQALAAAAEYLRRLGDPLPDLTPASLVLAGHQPELFHPGVWVKNFALRGIARAGAATPLNLIVDNDTAKTSSLRLPVPKTAAADACAPAVGLVAEPFDRWAGEEPYEERRVHDEALFASFADRAGGLLKPWGFEPLLREFWDEARRQPSPFLGERLAAARRALERRWGCHNLEVPLSALCRTDAFAWFAGHILGRLPAFHDVYNRTVRDYRRRHGIQSRNHPVPELTRAGDWWEAPFWAWRAGQVRRGRPALRFAGTTLELRLEDAVWTLPAHLEAMVAALPALEAQGLKLRTRALTTTLFARLFLGDLFLHGLGGAKYDALTDEILRQFYDIEPPAFLTLSATLHLPVPVCPARPEQRQALARMLRDLEYNPQRHLTPEWAEQPNIARLVHQKEAWIAQEPVAASARRARFQALRAISAQLRPAVDAAMRSARAKLECVDRQLATNAILQRRDYAFCLFPEAKLRPFCQQFLNPPGEGRSEVLR